MPGCRGFPGGGNESAAGDNALSLCVGDISTLDIVPAMAGEKALRLAAAREAGAIQEKILAVALPPEAPRRAP